MEVNSYWFVWGFGMLFVFGIKLMSHMLNTEPGQYSLTINILRYLFLDAKVAVTSFISFTFELLCAAWYIDRLPLPYMPTLPSHWTGALFLSAILELIAPICVRGIVSWTVDKINRFRGVNVAPKPTTEN